MVQLIVTYDTSTGQVNVNGPIVNRGLCYLMLEMARDAIHDFKPPEADVVPASPLMDGELIKKLRKRG